jgi:hypothetical protein
MFLTLLRSFSEIPSSNSTSNLIKGEIQYLTTEKTLSLNQNLNIRYKNIILRREFNLSK